MCSQQFLLLALVAAGQLSFCQPASKIAKTNLVTEVMSSAVSFLHETRPTLYSRGAHQWLVKLRLIPPHKLQLAAAAAAVSCKVLKQEGLLCKNFSRSLFRPFFSFS